jgi:hypothetical protein
MDLAERWFAEITNKWIRSGTHRSIKELAASITNGHGRHLSLLLPGNLGSSTRSISSAS